MAGKDEQARRERRGDLAVQFREEVAGWTPEKLRQAYAQPEIVRAAEARRDRTNDSRSFRGRTKD